MPGHQVGNEFLFPQPAQDIRRIKVDGEEMPADGLPEGRAAGLVDVAAHLGDHHRRESLRVRADEQEARQRKQAAGPAAAPAGLEEKRANLRRPAMLLLQVEHSDVLVHLQRGVNQVFRPDFVAIPRLETADPRRDARHADDFRGRGVLEGKQVELAARLAHAWAEGAEGVVDPVGEEFLVGRQGGQAAAGGAGQGRQAGTVIFTDGAKNEHRSKADRESSDHSSRRQCNLAERAESVEARPANRILTKVYSPARRE